MDIAPHPVGCRICALHRRRLFTGALLAGGAGLVLPAFGRDGVDVAPPSAFTKIISAEQVEAAATEQYSSLLRGAAQQRALAPESHPAGGAPAQHLAAHHPAHLRMESAGPRLALGSQPDRQQADQRVLHAGRQDRLLLRHPRPAQAHRRRGRDGDGPRDDACAARARARADGQDDGHPRRDRDRLGDPRPGQRRPHRGAGIGGAAADPALRPRGRDARPISSASSSPHAPATTRTPA